MTPVEALQLGREILDPVFKLHGFEYADILAGKGSGGYFASAEYSNGERRIELHFRQALGLVRYHFGHMTIGHEEYMAVKLGGRGRSEYPGFSSDPIDGFQHLRKDLESHCGEFLLGDRGGFGKIIELASRLPRLPQ